MKMTLLMTLGIGALALGPARFSLHAQDAIAPILVSAASLDGAEVGVCFSEPMSRSGLDDIFTYLVADEFGQAAIDAVSIRPGDGGVVLRLSGAIASPFTVTIQTESLSDRAGNPLPLGVSVTGTVWSAGWALAERGRMVGILCSVLSILLYCSRRPFRLRCRLEFWAFGCRRGGKTINRAKRSRRSILFHLTAAES